MKPKKKLIFFSIFYLILIILIVSNLNAVLQMDHELLLKINQFSNPFLDSFFSLITYGGTVWFWAILIAIFYIRKEKKLSVQLLVGLLINIVVVYALKSIFNRSRPTETLSGLDALFKVNESGFPSGHSELSFTQAVIIGKYPFYALAILVAISRVYLGVHYPLDVLIGALNGIFIGMLIPILPLNGLQKRIDKFVSKLRK